MNRHNAEGADEFLPTRRSLLTRLKNWDDQEGWREFFDTYWKLIYRLAIKAGLTETDAEDLVQETIIVVARKMKTFRYDPAIGSFKAWLLLNIKSRIADHLRRRNRRVQTVAATHDGPAQGSIVETVPDSSTSLDLLWDKEWENHVLETALERVKSKVSVKQFQIFDLYGLQQVPLGQVTSLLGISAPQVYLAKHRVARLVRQEVKRLEDEML